MIILAKFASNLEIYRKIARCSTLQTYKPIKVIYECIMCFVRDIWKFHLHHSALRLL